MRYELVVLDAETGDEEELKRTGTWAQCERHRDEILEELEEDYDDHGAPWPVLMIQPAA